MPPPAPQRPPQPHQDPPLGFTGGSWGKPSTGTLGLRAACIPSPIASPPHPSGPLEVATPPFPPRLPPRARFPVPWRPILGPGAPGAVRCGREALRTQQPGGAGASLAAAASAPAPAPSIPARPRFGPMEPPPVGAAVTAERWPGVRVAGGGGGGPRWVVVQGGGTPRTLIHGCARGSPHTPRKGSPLGGGLRKAPPGPCSPRGGGTQRGGAEVGVMCGPPGAEGSPGWSWRSPARSPGCG